MESTVGSSDEDLYTPEALEQRLLTFKSQKIHSVCRAFWITCRPSQDAIAVINRDASVHPATLRGQRHRYALGKLLGEAELEEPFLDARRRILRHRAKRRASRLRRKRNA